MTGNSWQTPEEVLDRVRAVGEIGPVIRLTPNKQQSEPINGHD